MWLFKAGRPGQGEHWAEVVSAGLADLLGLPHAHYELAHWRDRNGVVNRGVVTRGFIAEGFDLVHGDELLHERDPNYPQEPEGQRRYVRTKQHTIDAVWEPHSDPNIGLPLGWGAPGGVRGVDVLGGYLLLDAWIGNTDRHHQNWAVVVNLAQGQYSLAPTFDHASSLGAHETDQERLRRLESRDPAYRVEGYVQRADARSALFRQAGDARPLPLIDAFRVSCERGNCRPWIERLATVRDEQADDLFERVPEEEMSGPAKAFARAILSVNRGRILRG